jgi:DNA-binding transcriptional LysR family regulator
VKFSLKQLQYIEAAGRLKSIAAASEAMRISKSSVAAAIDGFEANYKVTLFIRQPSKGLILTPAGKRLMGQLINLIGQAQGFDDHLAGKAGAIRGEFIIGCFAPLAPQVLPFAVRAVTQLFPDIQVKIIEGDLRFISELVAQGLADLALSYDLGMPEGAKFEVMGVAHPHAVFARDDPMADEPNTSLTALAPRPMILLDLPESRTYFELLFRSANVKPNVTFRTGTYQTLRSFVSIGLGYSILNLRPATKFANTGREVVCVPLVDDLPAPQVGILWQGDAANYPPAELFIKECRRLYATSQGQQHFVSL